VAIIGILAAIAIPQFVKYKKNAAVAACNADLRNCANEAAAQYANGTWAQNTACDTLLPGNKITFNMFFNDVNNTFGISAQTAVAYNGINTYPGFDDTHAQNGTVANCTL